MGVLSPKRAKEANLSNLAEALRANTWSAADTPGWGRSITVPSALFLSEVVETVKIGVVPCRPKIPGELVRFHIDGFAAVLSGSGIKGQLTRELEPFIIGVGEIMIDDRPEGFAIQLRNSGDILNHHKSDSL